MGDQLYAKRTTPEQVQEPAKTAFQRKPGPVDPTRIPLWATLPYGNQVPPSLHLPVTQPPQVETVKQKSGSPADVSAEKHLERALQDKENTTGLPDTLKAGIETLSGLAMDDVQVHYHSSKPAQVQALAYTQGTDIHVGPGQEQHLPHEAWHVVQQKQGRVRPTLQAKGVGVNDDQELEQEAERMGANGGEIGKHIIQEQRAYRPGKREEDIWAAQTTPGTPELNRSVGVDNPTLQKYRSTQVPYLTSPEASAVRNYRTVNGRWDPKWISSTQVSLGPNVASLTYDGIPAVVRESQGANLHSEKLLIGTATGATSIYDPQPLVFHTMQRGPATLYTEMAPCTDCTQILSNALRTNDQLYYSVNYNTKELATIVAQLKSLAEWEQAVSAEMNRLGY